MAPTCSSLPLPFDDFVTQPPRAAFKTKFHTTACNDPSTLRQGIPLRTLKNAATDRRGDSLALRAMRRAIREAHR